MDEFDDEFDSLEGDSIDAILDNMSKDELATLRDGIESDDEEILKFFGLNDSSEDDEEQKRLGTWYKSL